MDVEKLTPAPWEAAAGSWGNGGFYPYIVNINHNTRNAAQTDMEFITLAREAFDVMMRRKWTTIQYVDRLWGVVDAYHTDKFPKGLGGQAWPDPFTAIVEADKWYAANVEESSNLARLPNK